MCVCVHRTEGRSVKEYHWVTWRPPGSRTVPWACVSCAVSSSPSHAGDITAEHVDRWAYYCTTLTCGHNMSHVCLPHGLCVHPSFWSTCPIQFKIQVRLSISRNVAQNKLFCELVTVARCGATPLRYFRIYMFKLSCGIDNVALHVVTSEAWVGSCKVAKTESWAVVHTIKITWKRWLVTLSTYGICTSQ